jgi:leucyl-tRNA synthetase
MRDAVFSRQRYWGEPVPVYFKDGGSTGRLPYLLDESDLPLELPAVDKYLPTETGEPPLGRAEGWKYKNQYDYELSTMPGWAGSSWYWYRYMDPKNTDEFASKEAIDYWQNVDLYIGGTEHATGHLLYSRFWNKFLKDRGYVPQEEPFKKLINQGMIQGRSNFAYRVKGTGVEGTAPVFVSLSQIGEREVTPLHVDVNIVDNDVLDIDAFKKSRPDLAENAKFITEPDGKYIVGAEVEKMSKSKFNVVNPDLIVERYGADVLRLYEMFLGPLEQAKPWNTNGIDGVYRFLRKFWRLFYKDSAAGDSQWIVTEDRDGGPLPTPDELKVLHRTIQKAENDIETYSFNTSVSAFMVCVNELTSLNCHKRAILQELVLLLSPYAPHITEELWAALGNEPGSISKADFPKFNPNYLVENSFEYPIQINGKVRTTMSFAVERAPKEIEAEVLADEVVQKWLEGKSPKKVVVVPKRIVNVVV